MSETNQFDIIIVHPEQKQSLLMSAKEEWKIASHKRRWVARYKKPYPEIKGELSNFGGFKILSEI